MLEILKKKVREANVLKEEITWHLASERADAKARLTRLEVFSLPLPLDALYYTSSSSLPLMYMFVPYRMR